MELWSYAINKNVAVPKLVLMSATLSKDTTVFKDLPRKSTETKTLNYLDKLSIEASWQGDFVWSTGDKTAKIVVSPKKSSTFTVRDVQNCLSHQVQVNVVFPDTDGDGITDDLDKCPNTVKGQKVDAQGCADAQKDTDGDGITDDKDDCPTIVNPKAPVITQTNEINLTTTGGAVYQWFLNGIALTNSNSGNLQAIETGNYSVQFKTDKGCKSPISTSVMVLITEISEANTPKIFPNPVKESLQIEFPKVFGQTVQLSIFDIKGQLIWHKDHLANKSLLDLRFLPSGTFYLQLRSNENERLYTQKLLKE
jgi:hypothetical protein